MEATLLIFGIGIAIYILLLIPVSLYKVAKMPKGEKGI
jgi:hypothetical protein